MQEIIRVSDVEKYYGNGDQVTKAVDRVSFAVQQGEFIGVMGASGSGKTTLLNLLSTIDRVTAGHIYYGDTDITELGEEQLSEFRKKQLGFIFQEYNLLDTLTLEENIMLVMTLHRRGKRRFRNGAGSCFAFWESRRLRISIRIRYPADKSSGVHVPVHLQIIPHFFWQMSRRGHWIHWQRRHC